MKYRNDKVAVSIQKYVSDIIQFKVKNKDLGICSVTHCEVTNDYSLARLYISFLGNRKQEKMEEFETIIGYKFQNRNYLKQALSHSSYANEKRLSKLANNERLEFLGDAIIEFIITEILYTEVISKALLKLPHTIQEMEILCLKSCFCRSEWFLPL